MKVKVTGKINHKGNEYVKKLMKEALVETADALKSDLQKSQTMPFDTGALQNRSTFIDDSKKKSGRVTIVSDTPYARRLYFHPEYNFQKTKNKNAGGMWFETYINGQKKNWTSKKFAKIMKGKLQ
jgi:hypothetical protein|nr:MAG TPA: Minor capsid protein [Caudoviricetes sp.]